MQADCWQARHSELHLAVVYLAAGRRSDNCVHLCFPPDV